MAEEHGSLHIDTDWKKQAQEEKRRLAEEQAKRAATTPPPVTASPLPPTAAGRGATAAGSRQRAGAQQELPPASFSTLVQSVMTQALYYLGELGPAGGEGAISLDMAKHQIDTLAVLDAKTTNHLTPDERHLLDVALHETRTRFVSVASQYI